MAINQSYRNTFASLETGRRAQVPKRVCADCGTGIDKQGGKKRCGPCSSKRHDETIMSNRSKYHNWGDPVRFQHKTERQCVKCGLIKVTHHQAGVRCWTTFWRGLDEIKGDGTPVCEAARVLEAT